MRAAQCLAVLLPRLLPRIRLGASRLGATALLELLRCVAPAGLCASARAAAARALTSLAPLLSDEALAMAAEQDAFESLVLALAHAPVQRAAAAQWAHGGSPLPHQQPRLDWFEVSAVAAAADACAALCERPAGASALLAAGAAPALVRLLGRRSPAWFPSRLCAAVAIGALGAHADGARVLLHAGAADAVEAVAAAFAEHAAEDVAARVAAGAPQLYTALQAARAKLAACKGESAWHNIADGIG